MPGNIGPLEIAVVLIIVLIVFGPKRLPQLGNSLGRSIREFKETVSKHHEDEDEDEAEEEPMQLPAGSEAKGTTASAESTAAAPEQQR